MAFQSQLGAMRVFDDSNASELVKIIRDDNTLGGYIERDFEANPFGSICPAFSGDLIPRSEWADRIEELERNEATLEHISS